MKTPSVFSNILTLGAASILDYGIQLILPIILVRLLPEESYANYRMLFLLVNTAMALAPLYMPQALFYFLPQAQLQREHAAYMANTALFLMITGLASAAIINPWLPLIPDRFFHISRSGYMVPLFIFVWVLGSLIDSLPNAANRVRVQAGIMLFLSVIRVASVVTLAAITRNIEYVFLGLCVFSALKCLILLVYLKIEAGVAPLIIDYRLLNRQVHYALPFGISGALFMLKNQSDQWMAAALFSPVEYAVFSFGIYVAPLMTILRNAINNGALPIMSHAYAAGDINGVLFQYRRVNFIMACLILPVLAILFVAADPIIRLIFTDTYAGAANVMRVYILGFVAQCLESTTLLRLCNAGRFVLKLNLILLPLAILTGYLGAQRFGIPGAALGSVITLYVGEVLNLKKSATAMQTSLYKIIDWRSWSWILLATLVAGIGAFHADRYFQFTGIYSVISTASITALLACAFYYGLYLFKFIDRRLIWS